MSSTSVTVPGRKLEGRDGSISIRTVSPDYHKAMGIPLKGGRYLDQTDGANAPPAILINDRAVGTDQNKKFVMVVGPDNKATYREVTLGGNADGLRIVSAGLTAGDRIVVNGLQRVRPGALLDPQPAEMRVVSQKPASKG